MTRPRVLHAIEGRLRIKVGEIKDCPASAQRLSDAIRRLHGVHAATANLITGSITILYYPAQTDQATLCRELGALLGCEPVSVIDPACGAAACQLTRAQRRARPDFSPLLADVGQQVAQLIVKSVMEAAVKRAIYALI